MAQVVTAVSPMGGVVIHGPLFCYNHLIVRGTKAVWLAFASRAIRINRIIVRYYGDESNTRPLSGLDRERRTETTIPGITIITDKGQG